MVTVQKVLNKNALLHKLEVKKRRDITLIQGVLGVLVCAFAIEYYRA